MDLQREEKRATKWLQEANLCEVEHKDWGYGTEQRYEAQRSTSKCLPLTFFCVYISLSLSRISLTYSNCVPCCYGYLCCRAQQRCSCSNEDIKRGLTLSSHSWLCQKTESWWDDEVISIFDKKLSLLLMSLLWQTDVKIIFEKVFLANFLALIKCFFIF